MVIGSSTAAGSGATSIAASWAGSLQSKYSANGVKLTNIARIGTVTYQGLPTSSPPVAFRPGPDPSGNVDAALASTPKLVLVGYPHNDTAGNYTADETVGNLIKIRDYAQARGVPVIIVSTQPRNEFSDAQIARLAQIDASVSAQASPCFVEVRTALASADGRLAAQYDSGDGVHPNNAGHAVIFNKISALVDSGACVRL